MGRRFAPLKLKANRFDLVGAACRGQARAPSEVSRFARRERSLMKLKPLLFLAGAAGAVAAVIKRRSGGEQIEQAQERYEPPAEALAQRPTEAGGPPSDEVPVHDSAPAQGLNVPEHGPPEGAVMPDTSADDPLVREQEKAAEGDAAAIGGDVRTDADPAMRPVVEGIGDENEETFEAREGIERGNREMET
jgi:hypothetical protein